MAAWYEKLRIGATGGDLWKAVHGRIGDPFYGVHLNPGHLTSLDEWLSSPSYEGSKEKLVSGMAVQVDVIPGTGTRYFTSNIEDGLCLADAELRGEFAEKYPEAWGRIQARREFMIRETRPQARPRGAAIQQHPRLPAAVHPLAKQGDEDGLARSTVFYPRSAH